jgi:hypothetical protein
VKRSSSRGFTNQQAIVLLMLAFPVGLISLAIVIFIGLSQRQPQALEQATKQTTRFAKPAQPINRQPKQVASAPHPRDPIDAIADEIFWRRHPSLRGLKLTNQQGELAAEWAAIRHCEAIVDYRFYERFPHMRGRTIQASFTGMIQIWTSIRNQVRGCE